MAKDFLHHGIEAMAVGRDEADITEAESVAFMVAHHDPALVINAAAMTDVDRCEVKPAEALRVNAVGAGVVAAAAIDRPLVHISTDFVFQGNAGPYRDTAIPYPVQAYGSSKLLGEQAVAAIHPDHAILRIGWLYGVEYPTSAPMLAFNKSYTQDVSVRDHMGSAVVHTKAVSRASIWGNLVGTPSFVGHVSEVLVEMLAGCVVRDECVFGNAVLHVSPPESPVSWYELLKPRFPTITKATSQTRAQRPVNGGLVPSLGWELPDYATGIADWLIECDQAGLRTGLP